MIFKRFYNAIVLLIHANCAYTQTKYTQKAPKRFVGVMTMLMISLFLNIQLVYGQTGRTIHMGFVAGNKLRRTYKTKKEM